MNRLQSICALRGSEGVTAVDGAIETIRDWVEKWGFNMEPEELTLTKEVLGNLLELQANLIPRAVRLGETMSIRLTEEARQSQQEDLAA